MSSVQGSISRVGGLSKKGAGKKVQRRQVGNTPSDVVSDQMKGWCSWLAKFLHDNPSPEVLEAVRLKIHDLKSVLVAEEYAREAAQKEVQP